ncbi:MAG: sulfatase-like hydrolase/transferase [Planctomycetota bacterium]|jgi:arylsulfatase A-like enzyme|nr:sulfatase-like hydrolase/transferase [Planctomycetota bacterium]
MLTKLDLEGRTLVRVLVLASFLMFTGVGFAAQSDTAPPRKRPNILFIAVDDLRPQLGCYDAPEVISPNIDRLAARGTLFERAYCNVPVCGPSRVSVLTGLRTSSGQWSSTDLARPFTTMPAFFRKQGYTAISNGKVLHHMNDRSQDWSEPPWRSIEIYHGDTDWANYNAYGIWQSEDSAAFLHPKSQRGPYFEAADVPDQAYQDGQVADKTIADLKRLKDSGEPFFLACGFWRPHLPFNAPQRYWDLYDRDEIALANNRFAPQDLPMRMSSSREIDRYALVGERKASDDFHREARHAYYASVSYVDAQVGRVIDALDALDLADDTIIVLWGDHGWNLGEHDFWGKHNTFHNSLQVPLIICAPGAKAENRTTKLVELVDLYPTLLELSGFPSLPKLEGESIASLLHDPEDGGKDAVFSRWSGCQAVKTDRYLYTEWNPSKSGKVDRMLFDHQLDPQENVNLAAREEAAQVVREHSALLHKPNILYINVDDLGWMDLTVQGSAFYETPHIDRLAAQGMTFTNAYAAAANCAPSRACSLSGQYSPRHGVYTVGSAARGKSKNRKLIPIKNTLFLNDDNLTIADILLAEGYATATIGKWHVSEDPLQNGFEVNIAGGHWGSPSHGGYHSPFDFPNCVQEEEGEYLTDRLTDEAIAFMSEQRDQPFFLYLPFYTVHSPLQAKADKKAKYKQKAANEAHRNASYAAMIESLDENVGRLMATLEELGLSDKTLVLFTSDNGGVWNTSKQWPLRAGKGSYYEGGIREPLFVRWPGRVEAGSRSDVPVHGVDFFPTFAEAAVAPIPKQKILDGVSLMPLLLQTGTLDERALFWHFPIYLQGGNAETTDPLFRTRPGSVVRLGDWKLHEYFEDGRIELYNLRDDIGEKKNLIAEHPDKAMSLMGRLRDWRARTNAPVPTELNPDYKTSE